MHVNLGDVFRPIGVLNRFTELRHSKVKYKFVFLQGVVPAVAVVIAKTPYYNKELEPPFGVCVKFL